MNDKVFVLVLLLCSAVPLQLLHAHHTYISEQNAWELAEQRLGNAIVHFTRTEAERNNIHTKWDINNEEIRDATVSSLVSGVFSGVNPIGALENAFGTSLTVGLDINEDIILTDLLDTAITATETWHAEVSRLATARETAYNAYLPAWHAAHPKSDYSSSLKPETRIWQVPQMNNFAFTCYGKCSDTFTGPSSAKTVHQKSYWHRVRKETYYG